VGVTVNTAGAPQFTVRLAGVTVASVGAEAIVNVAAGVVKLRMLFVLTYNHTKLVVRHVTAQEYVTKVSAGALLETPREAVVTFVYLVLLARFTPLVCHWYVNTVAPTAPLVVTAKVAFAPEATLTLAGGVTTATFATELVTEPALSLQTAQ